MISSRVVQLVLLLQVLQLLLLPSRGQESVFDDDRSWNNFFRNMRATPQFPYPGTMNNVEWDQYGLGFPPGIWDTKDFLSILVLQPSYIGGAAGVSPVLWENYWDFFEVFLAGVVRNTLFPHNFQWNNVKIQVIWDVYIQMVKDTFCCHYSNAINGTFGFGCMDTSIENNCCKKDKVFETCSHIGKTFIMEWSSSTLQTLKFKFYPWLCIVYANKPFLNLTSKTEAVQELLLVCPNPCRNNPCDDLPNALRGSCVQAPLPRGSYRGEFTCRCKTNFFFDVYTGQCQMRPLCSMKPCFEIGTANCVDLPIGYECQCRPEYTGTICSELFDPCHRRQRSTDIAGNIACRTSLGNHCVPRRGLDIFACECVPPYRREADLQILSAAFRRTASTAITNESGVVGSSSEEVLPPDNCMAKRDACDRVSCGGASGKGRCMPSGDLLAFVCVCDKNEDGFPLFEGEFCETPVSQWRSWSHWGVCRPECGESCLQVRQRFCDHLDGQAYCKGSDEELRPCEPACQPCPNRSFVHLSGVFVKETAAPLLLAVLSLFLVQLLALAAVEWFMSPDVTHPL